jgi:hypothetical protein
VLQGTSIAVLNVLDLCQSDNRGGTVESSLSVFYCRIPIHHWHMRRQFRQRGRMFGKSHLNFGRAEQEMICVGFLTTSKGAAHFTPLD